jgi:hypothetical protein
MKNDDNIMAIFLTEWATIEKCLKSGVYGWHETQKSTYRQKENQYFYCIGFFRFASVNRYAALSSGDFA